jgi:dTDP-4-amino-4,6-dideoxygalactose transaminase
MIVEDACQAHGSTYHGYKAGSIGDAAGFSFYYSKNLGAYGEGGFITTNDDEIARRCRMIRDHGSETRYHHDMIGFNGRLDEIQALVCRVKLPHLADWNEARRQHAKHYGDALKNTPVKLPIVNPGNVPVFHLFVIKAPRRDELQAYLKNLGIFTGIHYPIPNHLQKAVAHLGYKQGDFPATEKVAGEILSLPMFAELTKAEIQDAATAVKSFYNS